MEFEKGDHRFYLGDESHPIAEVTYFEQQPHVWVLDHTFVDPSLRGQGVAEQLVLRVVQQARAEKAKIIPQCSYAVLQFQRKKEYADVLEPTHTLGDGSHCKV